MAGNLRVPVTLARIRTTNGRAAPTAAKGPEGVGVYGSGQWTIPEGYAVMKFMKGGLGNNHVDPNARLCMASAVVGMVTTYGVDEPSGCYDDFEKSAIHGTFLIDGQGKIRWQDISAEPFMDGAFLLKEAKRLLGS